MKCEGLVLLACVFSVCLLATSAQTPRLHRVCLSFKYKELSAETGIKPSVGSVGDSYDNALAETVNGFLKAEVIHCRGPWRSFEAVEYATLEWVDWFSNRRLLEPIGHIPPAHAETNFHSVLETEPRAAQPTEISLRQTRRGSTLRKKINFPRRKLSRLAFYSNKERVNSKSQDSKLVTISRGP